MHKEKGANLVVVLDKIIPYSPPQRAAKKRGYRVLQKKSNEEFRIAKVIKEAAFQQNCELSPVLVSVFFLRVKEFVRR